MKKICFSGTISAGKTTTLECLKSVFETLNQFDRTIAEPGPLVRFVGEAARDVFTKFPQLPRDKYETNLRIAQKIISNELREQSDYLTQTLICDRGILDCLVFASLSDEKEYIKFKNNEVVQSYLKTYDLVLLFSPDDVPYVEDEVRVEGKSFRFKLHQAFLDVLKDQKLKWKLVSGTTSQRVSECLQIILKEHYE